METHTTTILDKTVRRRVNFATSVKGIVTPEITVETQNMTQEETLNEAEELLSRANLIAKTYTSINNKE